MSPVSTLPSNFWEWKLEKRELTVVCASNLLSLHLDNNGAIHPQGSRSPSLRVLELITVGHHPWHHQLFPTEAYFEGAL